MSSDIFRVSQRLLPHPGEEGKTILVTSPNHGEGKTIIMHHLAVSCSSLLGLPILIADLQRTPPGLDLETGSEVDSISSPLAFVSHLQGSYNEEALHEAEEAEKKPPMSLVPTSHPNLHRLKLELPEANEYRLLQELLPRLRERYGMIFMEAPAVLSNMTPDPVVLSSFFDQTVMVLQPHHTPVERSKEAMNALRQGASHNLSVVLNRGTDTSGGQRTSLRGLFLGVLQKLRALRDFDEPKASTKQPGGWSDV